jgi:hypothetical protein
MTSPNDAVQPISQSTDGQRAPWRVFTDGGIVHVDWDNEAPVTPNGQLPFFAEYLHSAERFRRWCGTCPLTYRSNNAPQVEDVLGTLMLSVLNGHTRTAGCYSQPGLWEMLDDLGRSLWSKLIRGDVGYGNESMMHGCEERGLAYLFKVAQSQPGGAEPTGQIVGQRA